MTTFLLLPGAGGTGLYWHPVASLLEAAGHEAIALDLPGADPTAGLDAYAEMAVRAASERRDLILVAQAMGGFTAPLVAQRVPLRSIVLLNAMIPLPGETAGDWWGNVEVEEARIAAAKAGGYAEQFDLATYFLHDLSPELVEQLMKHEAHEAPIAFRTPCAFEAWPAVPIHLVAGADDRFFPPDFQERIARERLGGALTSTTRVPGGHLAALAHPEPLARRLIALAA